MDPEIRTQPPTDEQAGRRGPMEKLARVEALHTDNTNYGYSNLYGVMHGA